MQRNYTPQLKRSALLLFGLLRSTEFTFTLLSLYFKHCDSACLYNLATNNLFTDRNEQVNLPSLPGLHNLKKDH